MRHPEHGYELKPPSKIAAELRHMRQSGSLDRDQDLYTNVLMVVYALQEICDWLTQWEMREVSIKRELAPDVRERIHTQILDLPDLQDKEK